VSRLDNVSRRDFLARSGQAVAGLTILKSGWAQGANETIGVGVAGINGRGQSHIAEFAGIEGCRIVALCDPDASLFEARAKPVVDKYGYKPKFYQDIRDMLADAAVDVVSIATTNHWHALATIWSCQAGKDVYVEKPASWSVWEGRKMVEAARKYERIVQVGTQSRSDPTVRSAIGRLWAGQIGKCFMSRGICFKPRGSIGFKEPKDPPAHLSFDLWLGPAPAQPYHGNLVHYNWHWFWDFGNGDLGNQGVHQMDIARWGLNRGLPTKVHSMGGRLGYTDQGQTANTQTCTFEYDDGTLLVYEVRGLPSNDEGGERIGDLFYGPDGWMASGERYEPRIGYKGDGQAPEISDLPDVGGNGNGSHFGNFVDAVRSRDIKDLNADILEGHLSAALCHLANISLRVGRSLTLDPEQERFVGDGADEANKLLKRHYREPYVIPENV